MKHWHPEYTVTEEIANAVTHGVGVALAIAGLTLLVVFSALRGDALAVAACTTFGITLVLLYTASTLYHSIPHPRAKSALRIFDHSAIYLLIAGTYTPITLVSLRGPLGWSLLVIIWTLAVLGVVLGFVVKKRKGLVTAILSVIMGWIAVAAIKPLFAAMESGGLVLILLGGIAYTGGIAFYGWKRLPYNHAVWHLFVLAGSAFHYFAVLFYVIPK
ncbi:MAG TPA: hemolysin III family protein [Thermoanaerobaculia bacterium]|nr:hemolysin III family protein [Thermoanaerobaculia bacterium]